MNEADYMRELESRVCTAPTVERVVKGTENICQQSPEDIAVQVVEILASGVIQKLVIEVGKPIVVFEYNMTSKTSLLSPDALEEAKTNPVKTVYPAKGDL